MSNHRFFKSAKNTSGLPSRVSNNLWGKLKKFAHDVWEIGDLNEELVAVRKRQETAQLDFEAADTLPNFDTGDVIVLLLGGRQLEASVIKQWDDGTCSLRVAGEGYVDNVHVTWIEKKAQVQPAPVPRAITREDIPVQNAPPNETAEQLQSLLTSRGGHVAVEISPSSILELQAAGTGVLAKLWHISTEIAHQKEYGSVATAVQDLGLNGNFPERRPPSLSSF